jgi:hypothetical protein
VATKRPMPNRVPDRKETEAGIRPSALITTRSPNRGKGGF